MAAAAVHFIGIGGAGMSGIARLLLARGVPVSGSDANESALLADLRQAGATVWIGHDENHLGAADTVVRSTAIREENPELAAARRAGLRVLHRSEALALAMGTDQVIAVAGTHGKTTTSAMTAVALRGAGLDPSFAIGAEVPELGSNAALGSSAVFVAEADESDGSFLNYRPRVAVVTNVEPDHLDFYGTAEAVHRSFERFVELLPQEGVLVVCADDPGATALGEHVAVAAESSDGVVPKVWRYGRSADADFRLQGAPGELTVVGPGLTEPLPLSLEVPGEHNALNAVGALAATALVLPEVGAGLWQAAAALASFRGASRRFEFRGEHGGVRVYDDYAHHPTEVRATLAAARSLTSGQGRVLVLFQPHLFSRTREFATEFAQALALADEAWVMEIYPAREDPIPGVSSALITGAGLGALRPAPDAEQAVKQIVAEARPGDLVLTVGAGSVTEQAGKIIAALMTRTGGEVGHAEGSLR